MSELIILRLLTTTLIHPARRHIRTASATGRQRGSVTLEQVAIAAGLLVIALAAVAAIGVVVVKYTNKLQ